MRALAVSQALTAWVKGATKAKLYAPKTVAQFESQCVRKPWCLVVLTATGRLNDGEKKALQGLAEKERRLRVVKIDASKNSLMLDLPGGELPSPAPHAATLVLLREYEGGGKSGAAAGEEGSTTGGSEALPVMATHLPSGLSDPADTGSIILKSLSSPEPLPSGFALLQKRPVLRPIRVVPQAAPRVVEPQRGNEKQEPASKTLSAPHAPHAPIRPTPHDSAPHAPHAPRLTPVPLPSSCAADEELKALREERQRVIKEAEQNRRAQMAAEEASAANVVEEIVADGGGAVLEEGGDEGGGDEAEEEVDAMDFD